MGPDVGIQEILKPTGLKTLRTDSAIDPAGTVCLIQGRAREVIAALQHGL
jgi:hypothetical protein